MRPGAEHDRIRKMYYEGKTAKEMAEATGLTTNQIYYSLDKQGLSLRERPNTRHIVAKLIGRGLRQSEVARVVGISRQRVHQIVRKTDERK